MPPENLRLREIARSHLAHIPRNVLPSTLETLLKPKAQRNPRLQTPQISPELARPRKPFPHLPRNRRRNNANLRTTSLGAPKPPESDLGLCELRIDPNQLLKQKPASHHSKLLSHNLPHSHLHHATERDSLEIHYHHNHHINS